MSRERFTLDQEFHGYFVQMTEDLYLGEYFREVYQRTFLPHRIEGLKAGRAQKVVLEHNEIFEAISQKDVDWTKESIKTHIKAGKEYIFSIIFS